MKLCSACNTLKPLAEMGRHKRGVNGYSTICKACGRARTKAYRDANPQKVAAAFSKWRKSHPEQVRVAKAKQRRKNPGREKELRKGRRARFEVKHPGRMLAITAAWKKVNSDVVNEQCAARKAKRRGATPAWANKFFIREAYNLAKRRTKVTGFVWHVDHIVPLKSKIVCGLHVEHNLQVIPGVANIAKGNRSWPDMPGELHG